MAETFTEDEVYRELKGAVADAGSQTALAAALGISTSYVNLCVKKRKPIRGKLLRHIGFEYRPVYAALARPEDGGRNDG